MRTRRVFLQRDQLLRSEDFVVDQRRRFNQVLQVGSRQKVSQEHEFTLIPSLLTPKNSAAEVKPPSCLYSQSLPPTATFNQTETTLTISRPLCLQRHFLTCLSSKTAPCGTRKWTSHCVCADRCGATSFGCGPVLVIGCTPESRMGSGPLLIDHLRKAHPRWHKECGAVVTSSPYNSDEEAFWIELQDCKTLDDFEVFFWNLISPAEIMAKYWYWCHPIQLPDNVLAKLSQPLYYDGVNMPFWNQCHGYLLRLAVTPCTRRRSRARKK